MNKINLLNATIYLQAKLIIFSYKAILFLIFELCTTFFSIQ